MVGGGSRGDEGSLVIKNTNVYAALETLRKKKNKTKGSSKEDSGEAKAAEQPLSQVVWTPAPLNSKSWADVDDEDDDDYYSTMAPIQPIWEAAEPEPKPIVEESESEEDILDEGDEDEKEHETEAHVHAEFSAAAPVKEAEKQLSKKELAVLEALLADFGVGLKESCGHDESRDMAI